MITNITITNIKGFGTTDNSLDLELRNNRVNIVVAPNGLGKSSLATAIKCVSRNGRHIIVDDDDKYKKDKTLVPSVSITLNGTEYVTDNNRNEINSVLSCKVINSRIMANTTSKIIGSLTSTKGYIDISDIDVTKVVHKPNFNYKMSEIQHIFGTNGRKVIKDISNLMSNKNFLIALPDLFPALEKFKTRKRETLVEDVNQTIRNVKDVEKQIDDSCFSNIEKDNYYQNVIHYVSNYIALNNKLDTFQVFFQLDKLYQNHRKEISELCHWASYEKYKSDLADSIQRFNTSTWAQAEIHETKGNLVIQFPKADELSNGQRDILTFITQLIIASSQLSTTKKNLVIIDEVFDYMDDATQIAAQYYLSKMLDIDKGNIYLIMLTHLDPNNFRSYIFNKRKINIQYLTKSNIAISDPMRAFITYRDSLRTGEELYNKLSRYFFHYDPDCTIDLTGEEIPESQNLKKTWFKLLTFKEYILEELNKYLKEQGDYDPYSVCFALRFGIEKQVYNSLRSDVEKQKFIDTFGTEKKLDFAENHNAQHSDSFHILAAIYNDAEHSNDFTNDKRCIFKLQNKVIRDIIKTIFDYHGIDLDIDCIK